MLKETKVIDLDAKNISFFKKVFFDPISIEIRMSEFLYGVYVDVLNGSEMYALRKEGYTITKVYPVSANMIKVIIKKED